jgi:hypothetical protein
MPLRLGIDIACRAAHQVSLADEEGRFIWTGRRFHTTPQDLARLWSMLPDGTDPAEVLVVMEPTRNAWAPLAPGSGAAAPVWCWFHRNARRICQTVAFSDFHATAANPAPTACYADAAFVAERFRFIEAAGNTDVTSRARFSRLPTG